MENKRSKFLKGAFCFGLAALNATSCSNFNMEHNNNKSETNANRVKAETFISDEIKAEIADINVALEQAGINATVDINIDAKPNEKSRNHSGYLAVSCGLLAVGCAGMGVVTAARRRDKDEIEWL